jgi:hypothetical protein
VSRPRRQPTLEDQLALVAGLQKSFHALLDKRLGDDKRLDDSQRLEGDRLDEALQIARWLTDSALCIARLKRELAAQGGGVPSLLARSLERMYNDMRKRGVEPVWIKPARVEGWDHGDSDRGTLGENGTRGKEPLPSALALSAPSAPSVIQSLSAPSAPSAPSVIQKPLFPDPQERP